MIEMKTFEMQNQASRSHMKEAVKFQGADLSDAIKSNFKKVLDASTYYGKPFVYPITVKITPPDRKLIRAGKPSARIDLEWMWATHRDRPATKQDHFFYVNADDINDLPEEAETFVVLGN